MKPLGPGRIFWVAYPGGRGGGKKRPMIVASRRTDLLRTGRVFAVVCSTDFDEPLLPEEVRLDFEAEGRCSTGLKKATVAVCDWTTSFPIDQIGEEDRAGLVPTVLLREIFAKAGITFVPER